MAKRIVVRPDALEQSTRGIANHLFDTARTVNQMSATLPGGRLVTGVALTTTTALVKHGLGKKFTGWLVVDSTANAVVYRDTTSTADNKVHIPLKASATTTVSLWVF